MDVKPLLPGSGFCGCKNKKSKENRGVYKPRAGIRFHVAVQIIGEIEFVVFVAALMSRASKKLINIPTKI